MGMQGKYGRWGHEPRCNCLECNATFVEHNRQSLCGCIDCTYMREIGAPPPPVTPPRYVTEWPLPPEHVTLIGPTGQGKRSAMDKIRASSNYGKVKDMAGLHMCERKGCGSLIRGEATALVDYMPNTMRETERKGYELCPGCSEDVHALLTTDPLSERVRAYDEAFVPGAPKPGSDAVEDATAEQLAAALFQKLMKQASISATPHTIVDQDED